jgi:hypothetical protein
MSKIYPVPSKDLVVHSRVAALTSTKFVARFGQWSPLACSATPPWSKSERATRLICNHELGS